MLVVGWLKHNKQHRLYVDWEIGQTEQSPHGTFNYKKKYALFMMCVSHILYEFSKDWKWVSSSVWANQQPALHSEL